MRSHHAFYLNSDLNGVLQMLRGRAGLCRKLQKALKPAGMATADLETESDDCANVKLPVYITDNQQPSRPSKLPASFRLSLVSVSS